MSGRRSSISKHSHPHSSHAEHHGGEGHFDCTSANFILQHIEVGVFEYSCRTGQFRLNNYLKNCFGASSYCSQDEFVSLIVSPSKQEFLSLLKKITSPIELTTTFTSVHGTSIDAFIKLVPHGDNVIGTVQNTSACEEGHEIAVKELKKERNLVYELRKTKEQLCSTQTELDELYRIAKIGSWRMNTSTMLFHLDGPLSSLLEGITGGFSVLSLYSLLELTPPDEYIRLSQAFVNVCQNHTPISVDFHVLRATNCTQHLQIHGRATHVYDNGVVELAGTIQDVSEFHEAQSALRYSNKVLTSTLNILPSCIIVFENNLVQFINKTLLESNVLPKVCLEPAIHRSVFVSCLVKTAVTRQLQLSVNLLKDNVDEEMVLTDGRVFSINVRTDAVLNCSRTVFVLKDMTNVMNREKDLRESIAAAERQEKATSYFLASVSHEIRSPLSCILGMASIMKAGNVTDEQSEMLDIIESSSSMLMSLINDVLDFSKTEAGAIVLAKEPFNLPTLISEPLLMLRCSPIRVAKQLSLTSFFDPSLDIMVEGDPFRLRQIVLNLVSNAVKFTAEGYVCVECLLLSQREDNKSVTIRISVRDSGAGIDIHDIPKLFEPFVQLKHVKLTPETTGEGTGLGLPISQRLCNLMNTNIEVESEVGVGSKFWFDLTLPVLQVNRELEQVTGLKALIAFTSPALATGLRKQLRALSMEVTIFHNSICKADIRNFHYLFIDSSYKDAVHWFDNACRSHCSVHNCLAVLCQDCSKKMELEVTIRSHFQKTVFLPVTFPEIKTCLLTLNTPKSSEKPAKKSQRVHNYSILVADDNPLSATTAKLMLVSLGFHCKTVEDGKQAITEYLKDPYALDVIILDFRMPNLTGPLAAKRIRSLEREMQLPAVVIVGLTGDVQNTTREEGMASGMDEVLTKPFTREQIMGILKQHLFPRPKRKAE
ncbi:hypothetical protein RCL1_007343 [Eukaryota sp. TZLM3-RCL]